MIGEIKATIYLDRTDFEQVHSMLAEAFKEDGEPIPPFSSADEHDIDACIKAPQSEYFGEEQYPTLASKAAILFYTLNKKHLFPNGNKRISVACLLVFLIINGKKMKISPDALTEKALWLAQTTHGHSFEDIKQGLEIWVESHIVDIG